MAPSITTRQLTAPSDAEYRHMVALLEETLVNDTALRCVSGNSQDGRKAWCKLLIDKTLREGQLWATGFSGRIDGLAFWFGPGVESAIAESDEYSAMISEEMREWVTLHYRPQYYELYRSTYATGSRVRIQSWHLKLIAVRPSHQRQGLGRSLVAVIMEKADRDSQAMTADVPTAQALYFLQRLGFQYTGVKNFLYQRSGFPLWCMIREPPTSSGYH